MDQGRVNFIIVTQGDILYTPIFFEEFLGKGYEGNCKGVAIQDALGNNIFELIKRMHAFYGTKDFIRQGLKFVSKRAKAKLYGLGIYDQPVSIANFASHFDIPVLPFKSVNTPAFKKWVKKNNIDLIVSIAASELFDEEILQIPSLGCINFHNAPLPNYRGMLPNFWQMYHDEEYSVLTVHTMTEELDKGEIIYQGKTEIKSEYSLEDLIFLTKKKSAGVMVKLLNQFREKEVNYRSMPDEEGSYFTFPDREAVRKFKDKGYTLL